MNTDGSGFNIWEIAKGGWVLAAAVVAWVGRGHMAHDSKIHEGVFGRLQELESDRVTKDDISDLGKKIDAVLLMLAGQNQRDRDRHP